MNLIYRALNRLGFLSGKYALKFFFAALLGVNVPLLLFSFFFLANSGRPSSLSLSALLLLFTIFSIALTFLVVYRLLDPLVKGHEALDNYLKKRKIPNLPTHFKDEAGRLLQKIQVTIETLDATINEKKDLVSLMSHDVRTPLSQVIGMCGIIQLTDDKAEINEYCQILIDEMGNQLNFLEQVVRMNRLDDMEAAFSDRDVVPVADLVDRAMHTLNVQTVEKPIDWKFEIEKDMSVNVNPHLFSQALQNIIGNAIKFSAKHSSIRIACKNTSEGAMIEVTDQGMGFVPEDAYAIFDRFTTKGKTGQQGEKSSGLGLYLTKNIIERHDGTVNAFSKGLGKGSTFKILLPRH